MTIGPPENPANYMGPVISARREKTILEYIEIGKREGRLLVGERNVPASGHFIAPTVIADIDSTARIFQEEIFGPVLTMTSARDFTHALELANDTEYGLTGSVYSSNPEKIRSAKEEFFVGQPLHQSEMHGRYGRRASLWRIQYVRDRFEGWRPGLPAAIHAAEAIGEKL